MSHADYRHAVYDTFASWKQAGLLTTFEPYITRVDGTMDVSNMDNGHLAWLLGRSRTFTFYDEMTGAEIEICKALAGEHGWTIYKMLLGPHGAAVYQILLIRRSLEDQDYVPTE